MNSSINNSNAYGLLEPDKNIFYKNLDLIIPGINPGITQEQIIKTLYEMGIANVEYVDIIAIKDLESGSILQYNALVHLIEWLGLYPASVFEETKTFTMYFGNYKYDCECDCDNDCHCEYDNDNDCKFWVLNLNNDPSPRRHVKSYLKEQDQMQISGSYQEQIDALKISLQKCEENFAAKLQEMNKIVSYLEWRLQFLEQDLEQDL